MGAVLPDVYDSLTVRLISIIPAILFLIFVPHMSSLKRHLLLLQVIQVSSMIAGLIWVTGITGFHPYYLAASLLGIVGASLTVQTRTQVIWVIANALLTLLSFFVIHNAWKGMAIAFFLSAFVITVILALVKVFAHENEFMLRTALHQAMEDLKIEKAKAFVQAEQAFLGELSSSLAHEINTPLATIQGALELVKRSLESDKPALFIPRTDIALRQIDRIKNILDDMLFFSGTNFHDKTPKNALELIVLAVGLLRPSCIQHQVQLEVELPAGNSIYPQVSKDYVQAIFQVVKNAIEAASQGKQPRWVKIQPTFNQTQKVFEVRIVNSGPGLPAEIREKIFLPFYTQASKPGHLGLGLNTARNIMEKHNGKIEHLASEPHTTFLISSKLQ
jgi:signal transduction histidine kinase